MESENEKGVSAQTKQDLERVAILANALMQSNPAVVKAVTSLIVSRQLYAAGLYEVDFLLQRTDWKKKALAHESISEEDNVKLSGLELNDQHLTLIKEILINASAVQAQQPFDERVLLESLAQVTIPWLKDVSSKHSEYQAKQRKEAASEAEKQRVATEINLGFEAIGTSCPRSDSFLFVGQDYLLRWLMQQIRLNLVKEESGARQILELVDRRPVTSEIKTVSLPKDTWAGISRSNTEFQRFYAMHVFPVLSNPVDVVLAHDLLPGWYGMDFVPITTKANAVQSKLKAWAKDAGALVISCLPLDRPLKDNELNSSEYETLRVYNQLRGVWLKTVTEPTNDGSTKYEVWVGQNLLTHVTQEELDAFKPKSNIVIP